MLLTLARSGDTVTPNLTRLVDRESTEMRTIRQIAYAPKDVGPDTSSGRPVHTQYTLPSRPDRCHFRLRACKTHKGGPEERAREL